MSAVVTTLNVELPEPPVTDVGLTVQVAFPGQPVIDSATESAKPFNDVTVTVELPD